MHAFTRSSTRSFALAATLFFSSAFSALAATLKPTDLITKADALTIMTSVAAESPSREEKDEDSGVVVAHADYQNENQIFAVLVLNFSSAKDALAKMTKEFASHQIEGEDLLITEEKGLGDRAFWALTKESVCYIVLKGSRGIVIQLNGKLNKFPSDYREPLRKLIVKALPKM